LGFRAILEARSAVGIVRRSAQDWSLDREEIGMGEQRKYRSWTAQQKLEIVLAGLRGDRSVKEVCREHEIAETLYYGWRDKLLEGGREALAGKDERNGEKELRRKIRELERALGRKTYELEIAGEALRGWE
jgi:transposase